MDCSSNLHCPIILWLSFKGLDEVRAGLVLAGGRSSRFGFRDKSLFKLDGTPLILHVLERMEKSVDEVVISLSDDRQRWYISKILEGRDIKIVIDEIREYGPIGGINASIKVIDSESLLIVGCDMPHLNPDVVDLLFGLLEGYDAAIPVWENGFLEGLHSVYNRDALLHATPECIRLGERRILDLIRRLNVRYVPVKEIRRIDPELKTFTNINRPEDYRILY
ncbi:MAG: molybdopterin-guanine dinucleotide biosynthesis protein MobA [Candidatus Syntrophoarchaeum butanivorans]|uniref:Probable molybdenum cofactor guanylyltransferase n=1 Tax=Candidatus Syntropharchaeum butanivorans TaxID=1839936 RepID=A0A1F2P6Q8_9EURY|nr:MAG: molybdopterin-guanine dinucleotide biosynthesis protein MobA [Candidatus Syntrophoarchaeum butanivorans]